MQGLSLCLLDKISQLYKNRLLGVIRVAVRTTVGEFADEANSSVKACVTGMTLETFLDCLGMLFEQSFDILKGAMGVQKFSQDEGAILQQKCRRLQWLESGPLLFCLTCFASKCSC